MQEFICQECGKTFLAYPSQKRRFCSQKCAITKNWEKRPRAQLTEIICKNCGVHFFVNSSETRVKRGEVHYCSLKCRDEGLKRGKMIKCKNCGKEFYSTRNDFCSKKCVYEYRKKTYDHHKIYEENGYLVRYEGGYNKKGNVKIHREVVEKAIGRRLRPDEVVHHTDGDRKNNKLENLQVLSRGDHSRLHREKELKSGKELFGRGIT